MEGQDTCYSDVTATHKTLKQLTVEVKENGCKLCMDNLFLSREIFSDLTEKKFNCCGALWRNRKECHSALLAGCCLLA
jgi:predicted peroxiredoxin